MTILVVDDEIDVKTLFEQRFRRELRADVLRINFCYSGEQALRYLDEHPGSTQLVLSDINMPGMSGLELLVHIRSQPTMPPPVIMMITAYGDEPTRQRALALGADELLTKPVDFSALKTAIAGIA